MCRTLCAGSLWVPVQSSSCLWTNLPIVSLNRSISSLQSTVFHHFISLIIYSSLKNLADSTPKWHILARIWRCSLMLYFKEMVLEHLYHSKRPTIKVRKRSFSLFPVFINYVNEMKAVFYMKYLLLYPAWNFTENLFKSQFSEIKNQFFCSSTILLAIPRLLWESSSVDIYHIYWCKNPFYNGLCSRVPLMLDKF